MAKFEIRRASPHALVSMGHYDSAAPRGTPLGAHASDAAALSLAGAKTFLGFLRQDMTVAGPTTEQLAGVWPVDTPPPLKAGSYVDLEIADEIDVEGADFIVQSGTGAITSGASVGAGLGLNAGKWRLVQSGDREFGVLTAQLTPEDEGNTRIRIEVKR